MTEEDYINFHKERYGASSGETARDSSQTIQEN